ncbi:aminoglycoside phosphotransferase family protein [candidate division KSB1 bacterium]|nr:aminoglycoside phosphotransferase family protein [candidate division KSB1 bacterium]
MTRIATLPEDERLPHLQLATNLSAMQEAFQSRLPEFAEGRWKIDEVDIERFDYKPGRKCSICYELSLHDVAQGAGASQLLLGVMAPNGEAEASFAKAKREANFPPVFGPAAYFLPDLNMVLWGFPNDPAIKRLPALIDKTRFRALIEKYWERLRIGPEITLRDVATNMVKYVPQHRCTFRHVLELQKSRERDSSAGEVVVYSKIHDDKTDGEPFFKIVQSVRNTPVCQSGALLVPEPLFFDHEINAGFQRGLHGQNLDLQLNKIDLDEAAAKIGAVLAELHQCSLEGLEDRPLDDELLKFAKVKKILAARDSAYNPKLDFIDGELRKRFSSLATLSPAPIHGAFRLTQLLLVEGKLALVDLDGFVMGNPISDVGSFLAHLLYLPLKGLITQAQARSAVRRFCQAYREKAYQGLPGEVLEWYIAVYLAGREAGKCLDKANKVSKRDYESMIDILLDMAIAILSGKMRLD